MSLGRFQYWAHAGAKSWLTCEEDSGDRRNLEFEDPVGPGGKALLDLEFVTSERRSAAAILKALDKRPGNRFAAGIHNCSLKANRLGGVGGRLGIG